MATRTQQRSALKRALKPEKFNQVLGRSEPGAHWLIPLLMITDVATTGETKNAETP